MPKTTRIADLRARAEARLGRKPPSLERELELHKLELEMQNEELRRAHEELERVRDRYRELFDAAPVAYLTLDRHGRICAVNRAACALTGLSADQLVGLRLGAMMRVADADRLHIYLRNLAHGGAKRLVIDLLASHGTTRRVALDAAISNDGFLVVLTSTSQRLDETHQLAALGASTSTIAHEVNNLLHVIGASLESTGNAEACRFTLAHCKDLISRLLVVGLPETPRTQDVELDHLVMRTLEMLRPLVGRAIRVETALGAPGVTVTCDPVELELVIINLVSNAHDAMPEGGRLAISTRVVTTSRVRSLVLQIEDSGQGMSPAVQAHVFEPFFTTKTGGTGLGLATSRGIIERVNGTISVTSTPKAGTRFEIVLPVSDSLLQRFALGTESRPRITLASAEQTKKTILVVEDNSASRFAMAEHLDALGYTVVITESVDAALAAARAQHIDLALLDYRLRSTSGELLARHLRELHPELRVLLVSGYPRECITTNEHFLQKPFSLDELTQAVYSALETA